MADTNQFERETIVVKARHFIRWHQTTESRLDQLKEMTDWASHFNPHWKVKNMVKNAGDLFAALEQQKVRYLVMGGFAAIIYGIPRFTNDVDLFIEESTENIQRVIAALIILGSDQAAIFKELDSTIATFIEFDDLPVKIDVMVQVSGLNWTQAWENRRREVYQGQSFYVISRSDLIQTKRGAGRWQDMEDIKALEAIAKQEADDERGFC